MVLHLGSKDRDIRRIRAGFGRIDPDCVWRSLSERRGAFEAVGLGAEGGVEGCLSGLEAGFDESAVDIGGGEECDAGVPVLVVVPVEEGLAVCAGVFDGAEALRELGSVFQGFELGFGVGVVVGDMGAMAESG